MKERNVLCELTACFNHEQANSDLLCSLPSVEVMRSVDTLELPEISLVETHGLRVSAAQTLSNVSIVKSLAITEEFVADSKAESAAEKETASHAHVVRVEVP